MLISRCVLAHSGADAYQSPNKNYGEIASDEVFTSKVDHFHALPNRHLWGGGTLAEAKKGPKIITSMITNRHFKAASQNHVFEASQRCLISMTSWTSKEAFRGRHPSKIYNFHALLNIKRAISLETSFKNRRRPLQNSNEKPVFAWNPPKTQRMSTALKESPPKCYAVVINSNGLHSKHFKLVLIASKCLRAVVCCF